MTRFIRVNIQGYNTPTLINVDDISMISNYNGFGYITLRTMQQNNMYYSGSSGPNIPTYSPNTFQVQQTFADIEIMLGLRTAPVPFSFSLDELNKAEDEINGSAQPS